MIEKKTSYKDYKIEDFVCDDSFTNFVTNSNQQDVSKWGKWLSHNPKNRETALNAKILILYLRFKKRELSTDFIKDEWLKLKGRLNLSESTPPVKKRTIIKRKIWQYAAAASVLLIFAGAFYYLTLTPKFDEVVDYKEVIVPKGEIKKVLLSDGTLVFVNSDSRLKYDHSFSGEQREVFLEGEAWFDVKHITKKPFVVHTLENDITVLGTAFNVYAYHNENVFIASLERGKISVSHNNEKAVELKANQSYLFIKDSNKSKIVETSNIESYSAWKDGKLVFRNQRFIDILQKLERSHNMVMSLQNKEVGNCRYTGTFYYEDDITTILDVIKLPTPFDYEVLGDTIIIK